MSSDQQYFLIQDFIFHHLISESLKFLLMKMFNKLWIIEQRIHLGW